MAMPGCSTIRTTAPGLTKIPTPMMPFITTKVVSSRPSSRRRPVTPAGAGLMRSGSYYAWLETAVKWTLGRRSLQSQPGPQQPLHSRRQLRSPPCIGRLLQRLALRRVGEDRASDPAESDAVRDRQAEGGDHLAGMLGDDRAAQYAIAALLDQQAEETLRFAVESRAVDVLELHGDGLH